MCDVNDALPVEQEDVQFDVQDKPSDEQWINEHKKKRQFSE